MPEQILLGKTLDELKTLAGDVGLPEYTARQIADWLYKKDIISQPRSMMSFQKRFLMIL
jgi:23S rRNA (adenine2503-C2)-methyltransferase